MAGSFLVFIRYPRPLADGELRRPLERCVAACTELVHVVITGMAVSLASILWLLSNQCIAGEEQGGD